MQPKYGVGRFPHKKDQNNITVNKEKFITINQRKGWNGGGKTWANRSNKKSQDKKYQKQQQIDKKANGDTKSNNGVQLVDWNWICLCNKGCGFYTSHTTGLHNTWAACVQNNQPFTLPATFVF